MAARKAEIERMVTLLDNWTAELKQTQDNNVKQLSFSLQDAGNQLKAVLRQWPNDYGAVISANSKPISSDSK